MGFSDGNSLDGIVKSIREDSQYKKGGAKAMLAEAPVMLMKKGGNNSLSKAQDGGSWKAMKNSAWQNYKPKPFIQGPQATSEYKPTVEPKTNWVHPPASVTGKETDPRKRPSSNGMKMGGSKKRK